MNERENVWFSPDRATVLIPPVSTAGSPVLQHPILPPDPPDPPPSLPSSDFPSLSEVSTTPRKPSSPMLISPSLGTASRAVSSGRPSQTTAVVAAQIHQALFSGSGKKITVPSEILSNSFEGLQALPQKSSSPLLTNRASCSVPPLSPNPNSPIFSPPPPATSSHLPPSPPTNPPPPPPPTNQNPIPPTSQNQVPKENLNPPPPKSFPQAQPPAWVYRARAEADRSLKRLAPTTISDKGIPQVTVPDEVFERGAALHKDFIVGAFFAKMPSYKSIENVLNFLWGKGTKLEIHTNTLDRTMLVRIPNEFIRRKVVEKRIWYVGTAMFHVAIWSSSKSADVPDLASIPLWAHLKGVPFDLRHQEGLSYAAGLVGEPKETDDYTKNLTNIGIAHVKVEADLTLPLPSVVELKRQNGDVIPVEVEYPWVPPSCSHCQQIGHIFKDCLTANPKWVPSDSRQKDKKESPSTTDLPPQPDPPLPTPSSAAPSTSSIPVSPSSPINPPAILQPSTSALSPIFTTPSSVSNCSFSTPVSTIFSDSSSSSSIVSLPVQFSRRETPFRHKPSLKRPHVSPPLSPVISPNPFALLNAHPNKTLKLSTASPNNFKALKLTSEKNQNHPPLKTPLLLPPPENPFPCEGSLLNGVSSQPSL